MTFRHNFTRAQKGKYKHKLTPDIQFDSCVYVFVYWLQHHVPMNKCHSVRYTNNNRALGMSFIGQSWWSMAQYLIYNIYTYIHIHRSFNWLLNIPNQNNKYDDDDCRYYFIHINWNQSNLTYQYNTIHRPHKHLIC